MEKGRGERKGKKVEAFSFFTFSFWVEWQCNTSGILITHIDSTTSARPPRVD